MWFQLYTLGVIPPTSGSNKSSDVQCGPQNVPFYMNLQTDSCFLLYLKKEYQVVFFQIQWISELSGNKRRECHFHRTWNLDYPFANWAGGTCNFEQSPHDSAELICVTCNQQHFNGTPLLNRTWPHNPKSVTLAQVDNTLNFPRNWWMQCCTSVIIVDIFGWSNPKSWQSFVRTGYF